MSHQKAVVRPQHSVLAMMLVDRAGGDLSAVSQSTVCRLEAAARKRMAARVQAGDRVLPVRVRL